ncbi:tetratricopeptide repeat protein [Roseovarius aestuarii]|uniref:Uncharacterized protein n=2 Tax=Roseovarius aestuarii TaxID=475083 RepID=A0A1X7BXR2_9RHOB|nr:hypothetical protein [Roseovarius aestuarii]SMC14059.1 hypothetical protein ROA7745_03923 [Roseovarius aestuarii]
MRDVYVERMQQSNDVIRGSASRQAVASLRGYLYQIIVSASEWCQLKEEDLLFLEVAEDYAKVVGAALTATQVKNEGRAVTSNTDSVIGSINNLFELAELNPGLDVSICHLTTADIGLESSHADRVNGVATLEYWQKVARGADMPPLRTRLSTMGISEKARSFVAESSDDELRNGLIRRISWLCGQPGVDGARDRLKDMLVLHGDRIGVSAVSSESTLDSILCNVLETSVGEEPRSLKRADFLRTFSEATHVSVPVNRFVDAIGGSGPNAEATFLERREAIGQLLPINRKHFSRRTGLEKSIGQQLDVAGLAWLYGGTGFGKTTLATLFADQSDLGSGDRWRVSRLRGATRPDRLQVLRMATAVVSMDRPQGLLLDDLARPGDNTEIAYLVELIELCCRLDCKLIVTSHDALGARITELAGLAANPSIKITELSEQEICGLVTSLGGDEERWGKYIHLASVGGHPQLAHALAADLSRRGWPNEEFQSLNALIGRDSALEQARQDIRRRVLEELPQDSRRLLYRMEIGSGTLDEQALTMICQVSPSIDMPGEAMEPLLGPWVETIDGGYRTSPLVSRRGSKMLSSNEVERVHFAIASSLTAGPTLNGNDIDQILIHSLAGRNDNALMKAGIGLFRADPQNLAALVEHSVLLQSIRTDYGGGFSGTPFARSMLSKLNVLATAIAGDRLAFEQALGEFENVGRDDPAELRRADRALVTGKLCMQEGFIELVDDFPKMLIQLRDDTLSFAEDPKNGDAPNDIPNASLIPTMLPIQMTKARTVAALLRVINSLGDLPATDREFLTSYKEFKEFDDGLAVRNPWLAVIRRDGIPSVGMAKEYIDLGRVAAAHGFLDMAAASFDTAAVIFDENHDYSERALTVLDEANSILGDRLDLARARARVLHNIGDYQGQISVAEAISNQLEGSPVSQVYFLRELAIAKSLMGLHGEAAELFEQAAPIALGFGNVSMSAMAVGLRADTSVELYWDGRRKAALTAMSDALLQVEELDLLNPGPPVAVHAMLAHFISAIQNETSDAPTERPGIAGLLSGAASNPVPAKELMEPKPKSQFIWIWWMLAVLEQKWQLNTGIARSVLSSDFRHGLPTPLRASLIVSVFLGALQRRAVDEIAQSLKCALGAQDYVSKYRTANNDLTAQVFDSIPEPEPNGLSRHGEAQFWLLASMCEIALTDGIGGIDRLMHGFRRQQADCLSDELMKAFQTTTPNEAADMLGYASCVGVVLEHTRHGNSIPLRDLVFVSLRCMDVFARFILAGGNGKKFFCWLRDQWEQAVSNQSFRLKTPALARPRIEDALAKSEPSFEWAVHLLETVAPFSPVKVAPVYFANLRKSVVA